MSSPGAASRRKPKEYRAYKDAGFDWLARIPSAWPVRRLKYLAPLQVGKEGTKPDGAIYVGLEHIEPWTGRLLLGTQPDAVDSVVGRFGAGDVLFGKLRPYLAKVACPDFEGVCTSEIVVLRPSPGISQRYLMYSLLNAGLVQWLDSLTFGTRMPRLSPDQLGNAAIVIPSLHEQHAITTFLDRETARIDELVARKERLIELLQEKRTALITHAVTKGIDPTVPMKDSGIEWMGAIPSHWTVAPLKTFLSNRAYGISDSLSEGGDIRVLTMAHIQDGQVLLPEEGAVKDAPAELFLRPGDLLFNRTNSRELVGKVGLFSAAEAGPVTFASYLVRLRTNSSANPIWLNYLLNSSGVLGLARSMALLSVNQANLNPSKYAQIDLPLPPREEQATITEFLGRESMRISSLSARIREAIARLKELRTALISAAVTGKIDVRQEVA